MAKVDVTRELIDFEGNKIGDREEFEYRCTECGHDNVVVTGGEPLTLRIVSIRALMVPPKGEKLEGEKQLQRYTLAQVINKNDLVELESNDVVLVKKLIAEVYAPLITGQCWQLWEGKGGGDDEST